VSQGSGVWVFRSLGNTGIIRFLMAVGMILRIMRILYPFDLSGEMEEKT